MIITQYKLNTMKRYIYKTLALVALATLGSTAYAMPENNIAIGKTATASSDNGGNDPASKAIDGDINSRWISNTNDIEWWQVDLGRTFDDIYKIDIVWEGAWTATFDIEISNDGEKYTTVTEVIDQIIEGAFPFTQTLEYDETLSARYIRFSAKKRGTIYANSFWEFKVYSNDFDETRNIALNKTATAGIKSDIAKESNDGNMGTRWASGDDPNKDNYDMQWWEVDLGANYSLTNVDIFWEGAYAVDYVILGKEEESDEWKELTAVPEGTEIKVGTTEDMINTHAINGNARYVRIKSNKNSLDNAYGMSIWEVRIYADDYAKEDSNEDDENVTAIGNINTQKAMIYTTSEAVVVENADCAIEVYNMSGQQITCITQPSTKESIRMNKGLYIIKIGNQVRKVRFK